jgi:hypothetical protein
MERLSSGFVAGILATLLFTFGGCGTKEYDSNSTIFDWDRDTKKFSLIFFPSDVVERKLSPSEKEGLGIVSKKVFPELSTKPETNPSRVQSLCRHAASQEGYRLCSFAGVRRNHVQALANVFRDPSSEGVDGIRFTKGWFNQSNLACAATQATLLVLSQAADWAIPDLTGSDMSGMSGVINTETVWHKLERSGWKRFSTPGCAGIRPGDVVLTRSNGRGGSNHPSHVFTFLGWNGTPSETPKQGWDEFWDKASQDPDPTYPHYKRFAMAVDNNRDEKYFYYFRPIAQSGFIPPQDSTTREGCWFYMRGPTPRKQALFSEIVL